jgi:hypothetical protein
MNQQRQEAWIALQMARSWGALLPKDRDAIDFYTGWSLRGLPDRLRRAIEDVETAANWRSEVTEVLVGLAVQGEADYIRAWRRNVLVEIGEETAEEASPAARRRSAEDYADQVMAALEKVADLIEEEGIWDS